ncbi:hypothetical protein [Raineyella fluvialis]|uniref:Uncharacterized protein n=1 Tax=Raineyella fluvialis TaxID=2662261 RepID=A0A5Q2FG29_9ACTN|nr:hypothetical protein [Raineyella fluvialis]QGF23246.1 hypothetical protein Rai3103_05735 [Raineyella fluvialis]
MADDRRVRPSHQVADHVRPHPRYPDAPQHESLRGDPAAGLAAYVSAGLGAVAVGTLAVMYAVEVPRGGPFVFGRLNDVAGGLFYAATIPVIIQVHRRLPATSASRAGLTTVVVGSGAAAVSGILLALQVIPFVPSTAVSMAGIVSQAAWAALTQHRLLRRPGYPPRLARVGRAIGVAMLAALPVVGLGFTLGRAPGLRAVVNVVGYGVGGLAYVSWPVWLFAVGRHLRGPIAGHV